MQLEEDELRDAVVLVFANKQVRPSPPRLPSIAAGPSERHEDRRDCREAATHQDALPQGAWSGGFSQFCMRLQWYIQSACATTGEGLYEGLDWLSNELSAR